MTTFDYFLRKYFGARGKRLVRTLVVCAVVYGGLAATEWRVAISPFVLCLMTSVFSGGAMLRALAAADGQTELRHLLMLPENARDIVRGYIGALALYTLATKTLPLLAILLAVSRWSAQTLCSAGLCALCSVLLAALFRSGLRWLAMLWTLALLVVLRLCAGARVLLPLLALSAAAALILLARADAWAFLRATAPSSRSGKHAQHFLMLRYFLRHLFAHRNYLVNTAGLWLVAAALPFFFASFAREIFVAPLGFAILTLNTPLSVLLSADPTLDRAVRILPGSVRLFCLPYVVLLASANLLADSVFLISWASPSAPLRHKCSPQPSSSRCKAPSPPSGSNGSILSKTGAAKATSGTIPANTSSPPPCSSWQQPSAAGRICSRFAGSFSRWREWLLVVV